MKAGTKTQLNTEGAGKVKQKQIQKERETRNCDTLTEPHQGNIDKELRENTMEDRHTYTQD